jgi:hypothetical protein
MPLPSLTQTLLPLLSFVLLKFCRILIFLLITCLFLSKAARCDLFGRFNTLSALSFWPQIAKKDAATIVNANLVTAAIICFTDYSPE